MALTDDAKKKIAQQPAPEKYVSPYISQDERDFDEGHETWRCGCILSLDTHVFVVRCDYHAPKSRPSRNDMPPEPDGITFSEALDLQ